MTWQTLILTLITHPPLSIGQMIDAMKIRPARQSNLPLQCVQQICEAMEVKGIEDLPCVITTQVIDNTPDALVNDRYYLPEDQ